MYRTNSEASAVEMFPGVVRRTLNSGEHTTLVEVTMASGATVPDHAHPHEQAGYVASGRVRFVIDGAARELGPGDGYLVPGGARHEVTALEDAVCVDVFSPVREEYL
jgi:quercetin dioxygenase-like cupin family protein